MSKDFNTMKYNSEYKIGSMDVRRIKTIVKLVGKNSTVLDLGCGDGVISQPISKNCNDVSGIDNSEYAIKSYPKNKMTIYDLDLNGDWANEIDKKFDCVIAAEVIEHIYDTDKFLTNIHNVLKTSGELVLSTPNLASLPRRLLLLFGINPFIETTAREEDAGHVKYFMFQPLKILLQENGFEVIEHLSDVINIKKNVKVTPRNEIDYDDVFNFKPPLLIRLFPKFGKTIIVKAKKIQLS